MAHTGSFAGPERGCGTGSGPRVGLGRASGGPGPDMEEGPTRR